MKQSSGQLSEKKRFYLHTFSRIVESYAKINSNWRKVKPQPQSWLGFGAGKSGLAFNWVFKGDNRFGVELYIDVFNKEKNEEIFSKLKNSKAIIEQNLLNLSWERIEGKRASRIALYYTLHEPADQLDEKSLEELISWAANTKKYCSSVLNLKSKVLKP